MHTIFNTAMALFCGDEGKLPAIFIAEEISQDVDLID